MYLRKYISAAMLFCCTVVGFAQNRNSNWCFGDSSGIDFSSGNPVLFTSGVKSRGSCISMSDSMGQLLFSAYSRATIPGNTSLVKNRNNILMQNGGNIVGEGWYQELCPIPFPNESGQYYLFSVGVAGSSQYGLYFSTVDMNLDSGRGSIIQKNIQLQSFESDDCLQAIKHGNGRDWWILYRHTNTANNDFYKYLVTPSGISGPFIQSLGYATYNNNYRMVFSKSGSKMVCYDTQGLMEYYSFDRCSGAITLNQTIYAEVSAGTIPFYFGGEISPNEQYLYISTIGVTVPNYLIQYDLTAAVISLTADTIWSYDSTEQAGGQLKLAPDGKIYLACAYYDGINFNYPYPDSVFNLVNNNLSVINYPDSPGVACGFAPFSFNLGAGRCYWGLPNNPDYELGAVVNSMCDTVTGVQSNRYEISRQELQVFYHAGWQIAFINAEGLKGKKFNLQMFDLMGRVVYRDEGALQGQYFTRDLKCEGLAKGMYVVTVSTEKEVLSKKFIKQ